MAGYIAAVLADAPTHFWRCADPGGSVLHDLGGSPRALQLNNTALSTPYSGPVSDGGCAWFGNNLCAIYRDFDVTVAPPFTIECWFWQIFGAQLAQDFLAWINSAGNGAVIGLDANQKPHVYTPGGPLTAASAASVQQWHHLVATITVATSLLYLDAVQVATGPGGAVVGASAPMLAAGNLISSQQRFATAFLAECAVYPSALTPTRITAHYLAADSITSRPVSKAAGSFNTTTGVSLADADQLAAILAAVRRTL